MGWRTNMDKGIGRAGKREELGRDEKARKREGQERIRQASRGVQ